MIWLVFSCRQNSKMDNFEYSIKSVFVQRIAIIRGLSFGNKISTIKPIVNQRW